MAYQVAYEVAYQVAQSSGPVVAQSAISQRGQAERADMGGVAGGVANARKEHTNDRERQTDAAQAARAEG